MKCKVYYNAKCPDNGLDCYIHCDHCQGFGLFARNGPQHKALVPATTAVKYCKYSHRSAFSKWIMITIRMALERAYKLTHPREALVNRFGRWVKRAGEGDDNRVYGKGQGVINPLLEKPTNTGGR